MKREAVSSKQGYERREAARGRDELAGRRGDVAAVPARAARGASGRRPRGARAEGAGGDLPGRGLRRRRPRTLGTSSETPRGCARGRFDEAWLLPELVSRRARRLPRGRPAAHRLRDRPPRSAPAHALPAPARRHRHQLRDYDAAARARGIEPDLEPPRLPVSARGARAGRTGRSRAAGWLAGDAARALRAGKRDGERPSAGRRSASQRSPTRSPCAACLRRSSPVPEKRSSARACRRRAGARCPSSAPTSTRSGSPRSCRARALLVANDSGPMHLAAAVGDSGRRVLRSHRPGADGGRRERRPGARPLRLLLPLLPRGLPVRARVHAGS